ncbi:MAG TPA: hypothetical protein VGE43_08225, partial [Acidimicrobiales bacterium]
ARRLESLGVAGGRRLGRARVEVDGRFLGPGYGEPTPAALRGMELVPRLLGVPGEVTYSGKGMAALETWARERPRESILYWHTLSSTGRRVSPDGAPAADGGRLPDLPPSLRRLAVEPLVA